MRAEDFPLRWNGGRAAAPLLVAENGCWLWQGKRDKAGYGRLRRDGRDWLAHRWSYEFFVAPIGSLVLDHLCREPSCVNPAHLEPVSDAVNVRRGLGTKIGARSVAEIRVLYASWTGSQRGFARAVATHFGVAESTVRNLVGGFTWQEPKIREQG